MGRVRISLVTSLLMIGFYHHAFADGARFSAIPVPSEPKSIWLIDTFTGALSRCEAQSLEVVPVCSPWTGAPAKQPMYRYDPTTKTLVPMNEAAQRNEAKKKNSN